MHPNLLPPTASLRVALLLSPLAATAQAEVVINEIHYNGEPNTAKNEFVELHNTGPGAADLSGWFFDSGIDFTFPPGTEIEAGGYLVIAEHPPALLAEFGTEALGPFGAKLSGAGETLELRRADGTVADTVSYTSRFPWPVGPAGTGASMELQNPALDNDLGGSWRSSAVPGVLAEATLIPASAGWRWRKGDSEASAPADAWRAPGFAEDGSWTAQAMPVGYGDVRALSITEEIEDMRGNYSSIFLRREFEIAPGEVPPALLLRMLIDDGAVFWINGQEVHRTANMPAGEPTVATTADSSGDENAWLEVNLDGAAAYLVEGANTIAVHAFNSTLSSSDFGIDLELIRPASGVDSPPRPTPGARNSTFTANAPPQIRQVDHAPEQPASGQIATVTAKVTDPEGVASVTLRVQTVAPGAYVPAFLAKTTSRLLADPNGPREPNPAYHDEANWTAFPMRDDGTGGDAVAGDDLFTAIVPGQINRTLVRYRIDFEDALGARGRAPYADDESLNFAYFVYDGVPDYAAETRSVNGAPHVYPASLIESIPVYHVITTAADFDQAVAYNGTDQIERNNYDARSAYNWNCTFVYEGEVYDHVGYRLRQRNARYAGSGKRSFKFRFNRGRYPTFRDTDGNAYPTEWKFLASHKMRGSRGNYTWGIEQAANHMLWDMTGTPASRTHWFNLRVIRGAEEAPSGANGQYLGDHYGMLLALEEFDVRFLDSHGMEKGNLYKLISGRTDGVSVRRYLAPDGVDDGSDFQNIIFQLRRTQPDAWLHTHVNYDQWNRYHAIVDAVRHYDVQPNTAEHLKNRAYYFEPSAGTPLGRLWVLPWDSDTSWGPNWNGGEDFCKVAAFGNGSSNPRPEFLKEYRNTVREIRDLIWTEEQIGLLLDPLAERLAPLVDADRDRWIGGVGGSDSLPALDPVIADMKRFAFVGGSWVGGENPVEAIAKDSGISGQQGRDAYLDALAADPAIPETPTISYSGAAGFPQGGLAFTSSAFADPQGAGSFGAMEWRIAEITPVGGGTSTVLPAGSTWRYLDDGSDQGTAWREVGFDDSAWATGATPAGYGGISAFPTFATEIDFGGVTNDRHITPYFRTTLEVADPERIDHLTVQILVDDGAVLYVNGTEVLREGFGSATEIGFDTRAESAGNENVYDAFDIPPGVFVAGTNTLALEVHQQTPSSSDVGIDLSITATEKLLPPGRDVRFEWDARWESGALPAFGATIAPPAAAVTVGDTYRARVRHMDDTGRWSHWSDPVEFTATAADLSAWTDALVVSEIMYHPADPTAAELAQDPALDDGDFEFIEIANVGPTPLDLSEIRFTKGIDFDFASGSKGSIAPGERLVLVENEAAFNLRYGHASTPGFVVGTYEGNLSNGGENLKLAFGTAAVREFEFNDKHPWPESPDGGGPSLVLIAPESLPDHALAKSWRPSANRHGSPGGDDRTAFAGDPLGDDDGDGVPNLIQYAAGSRFEAGTDPGSGLPTFSFDRRHGAEDVALAIELSSDLESWRDGTGEVELSRDEANPDGSVAQTWRLLAPPGGDHLSFRLRASAR